MEVGTAETGCLKEGKGTKIVSWSSRACSRAC